MDQQWIRNRCDRAANGRRDRFSTGRERLIGALIPATPACRGERVSVPLPVLSRLDRLMPAALLVSTAQNGPFGVGFVSGSCCVNLGWDPSRRVEMEHMASTSET
jgi:hypothetical protein